ncbi:MAG: endonuclease domain-containing protein [Crocinitomicaceae bacterium]
MKRFSNNGRLRQARKNLRNNATMHESVLWRELKSKKLGGFKFRRQHSFGPYILDFYRAEAKLGIELDGFYHFTEDGLERDIKRDKFLHEKGIEIIRFENKQVFVNMSGVLEAIEEQCKLRVKNS